MKVWYTVKDGKIDRVQAGESPAGEADWKEAPEDWDGTSGDKLEWFDKNMRRISDNELVEQGKRKNKRGRWYNKETIETKLIYDMDEDIDENSWTKDAPIESEPYQKFDRQKNKWIVDTEKKEKAEKENRLGRLKSEIEDAERRQIRPMKAIIRNEATEDDTENFNKYEDIIKKLRPQVTVLENELKSA